MAVGCEATPASAKVVGGAGGGRFSWLHVTSSPTSPKTLDETSACLLPTNSGFPFLHCCRKPNITPNPRYPHFAPPSPAGGAVRRSAHKNRSVPSSCGCSNYY